MGQIPGGLQLLFLAYLLGALPSAAIRSARRIRESGELPPNRTIWINTIVMLAITFVFAWSVGRGFGYDPFAPPARLGAREWMAAAAALAACFLVRAIARATMSESKRRALIVYKLAPRTPAEWSLWAVAIVVASVAEETAYRGVAMQILWYALGDPRVAAAISAVAFGVAHWVQGWRSAAIVTVFGLVMQGLVAFTGTLLLAVLVHAVYDFVVGYSIAREAATMDTVNSTELAT